MRAARGCLGFDTCDEMWRHAIRICLKDGVRREPRGIPVLEVPHPVVLTLNDVHRPFIVSPTRRANYRFGMAEAAWILSGSDSATEIGAFNKKMLEYSDDGEKLWGAYGPRLMGQLPHVISTLKRDPHSRQAVCMTWRPQVGVAETYDDKDVAAAGMMQNSDMDFSSVPGWDGASWRSKDIPCTIAWHFQLRGNELDLTVFMRSHDVWLGMPYDVLSFTTVQRVVASILSVMPGKYNHVLSNLHLYESNLEAAQSLPKSNGYGSPGLPTMLGRFSTLDDVKSEFSRVLNRNSEDDSPALSPFQAAMLREPERWPPWKALMIANGRVKKST